MEDYMDRAVEEVKMKPYLRDTYIDACRKSIVATQAMVDHLDMLSTMRVDFPSIAAHLGGEAGERVRAMQDPFSETQAEARAKRDEFLEKIEKAKRTLEALGAPYEEPKPKPPKKPEYRALSFAPGLQKRIDEMKKAGKM